MHTRRLKRILITYLAFSFFIASVLAIMVLLAEYTPSINKPFQKFGIGVIVLNSVLWNLLLAVTGSLSLLNLYDSIRQSFLPSLLSFLLLPVIAGVLVFTLVAKVEDLFGFTEAFFSFLIVQTFFFFRLRSWLKRKDTITID